MDYFTQGSCPEGPYTEDDFDQGLARGDLSSNPAMGGIATQPSQEATVPAASLGKEDHPGFLPDEDLLDDMVAWGDWEVNGAAVNPNPSGDLSLDIPLGDVAAQAHQEATVPAASPDNTLPWDPSQGDLMGSMGAWAHQEAAVAPAADNFAWDRSWTTLPIANTMFDGDYFSGPSAAAYQQPTPTGQQQFVGERIGIPSAAPYDHANAQQTVGMGAAIPMGMAPDPAAYPPAPSFQPAPNMAPAPAVSMGANWAHQPVQMANIVMPGAYQVNQITIFGAALPPQQVPAAAPQWAANPNALPFRPAPVPISRLSTTSRGTTSPANGGVLSGRVGRRPYNERQWAHLRGATMEETQQMREQVSGKRWGRPKGSKTKNRGSSSSSSNQSPPPPPPGAAGGAAAAA